MKSLAYGVRVLLALAGTDEERLGSLVCGIFSGTSGPVARRLRPTAFAHGELILAASDDRWLIEGRRQSERLRRELNRVFKREVVRRITVRKSRRPVSGAKGSPPGEREPARAPAEVVEAAGAIGDPRARKAFLSFAARVAEVRAKRA